MVVLGQPSFHGPKAGTWSPREVGSGAARGLGFVDGMQESRDVCRVRAPVSARVLAQLWAHMTPGPGSGDPAAQETAVLGSCEPQERRHPSGDQGNWSPPRKGHVLKTAALVLPQQIIKRTLEGPIRVGRRCDVLRSVLKWCCWRRLLSKRCRLRRLGPPQESPTGWVG